MAPLNLWTDSNTIFAFVLCVIDPWVNYGLVGEVNGADNVNLETPLESHKGDDVNSNGNVKPTASARQATRGVLVGPKVIFKYIKQIYTRDFNRNGASTSGKKKQAQVSRQEELLVPTGNVDSESEVEVVFDETANLMASTSFKGGSDIDYGINRLLEK
ncbi:hypothetical protein Tco_0649440 [Tanacetum coccineum]